MGKTKRPAVKRGRPARTSERTVTFTIRVSPAELRELRAYAAHHALELASWARSVLMIRARP